MPASADELLDGRLNVTDSMRDILQLTRDNRLIAFSLFFWGLGDGLFYYIQPLYLKQLGADPVATGTVLSVAALTAALSLIPAGTIADYFGRRPIVIFGWALGAVGAGLMYLATDLTVFTIGLMIYMGTGFVIAPLNAYISEARGKQSVQRALTLVSAGFMAGAIVSPTLGGMLASAFGLRSVYGIASVLFVISCLALVPLSPQPVIRPTIGGTRYGPLLRNKPFLQFLLLYFAALVAIHIGLPFASNFIVDVRSLNANAVGLLGSFNSLGALILNIALGHTMPRRGFLLSLAFMVLWGTLFLGSGDFAILAAAYMLRSGANLARNMGSAQLGRMVAPSELGLAYGIAETVPATVLTIAPLIAGLLYDRSPALPFQVSLVACVAALGLVWWFAPRRDAQTLDATPVDSI